MGQALYLYVSDRITYMQENTNVLYTISYVPYNVKLWRGF